MKRQILLCLAGLSLIAGCATEQPFLDAKRTLAEGRVEEGLQQLDSVSKAHPGNAEYRSYFIAQRERALTQVLAQADSARLNGAFDAAEALYARAERISPDDARIAAGREASTQSRHHVAMLQDARTALSKGEGAKGETLLRAILAEDPRDPEARALMRRLEEHQSLAALEGSPQLKATLARKITLEFRDASLKAIFEVISRAAGINFIFDKDVRPDLKTTIFVRDSTIDDAIDLLLMTNQLDRKVVNENSLLVYPATAAKQKDYQDLVVKSFYLANADVKQTATMLRTMLKTRDVFVDERLNMVVMRDTPEAVRLAEKLVAAQDIAEPEALLDVEVLEVSSNRLQSLGVQWPTQVGYGLLQGATTATTTTSNGLVYSNTTPGGTIANGVIDLNNRHGLTSFIANPALLLNIKGQDTDANVLANPRIRVKNREKAKIHIGDKLPVFTSTATSTGFVSQSISYLDVGVKLDVQPTIGLDDEVTMQVGLEVSNIVRQVTTSAGNVAYQVGTRSAGTTLQLHDGETQVLAGLIQDEDRRSASKIPGLGDLPILGHLFANHDDTKTKTEIVLLITPHIVRNVDLPSAGNTEFLAGTESGVGRLGLRDASGNPSLNLVIPGATPAPPPAVAPAPVPQTAPAPYTGPMREEGLAK